ncbi:hypothetical protein [Fulvivirga ligni]|uniref:hypothetical protein n=1 Tax=Fulvivirga ligni TaxID=2904246 RepID=UPI001F3D12F5|nr:hypothetical protein [Fulvivirga ligni]UII22250.1 hypothetical protein LVD16_03270 [Fulvivirga ligni]
MKTSHIKFFLPVLLGFALIQFTGCGDSGDDNDDDSPNAEVIDLNAVHLACLEPNVAIQLPGNFSSGNLNEQAAELVAVVQTGNALITTSTNLFVPPATAKKAEADAYIDEDDEAYTWGAVPNKFLFMQNNYSYSIYQYTEEDDIIPQEILYVDQNEDCSKFLLTQYAAEDDDDTKKGEVIFSFTFQWAGTAKRMTFGEDLQLEESPSYLIRSFEDLSGEMSKSINGQVVLDINWSASGDGSYSEYDANGNTIDSGTWDF